MTATSALHEVVKTSRSLAKSSRARYARDLDQWIAFAGADPSGWTHERAQAFYVHLLDEKKLKPQSANRLMASLSFASKWWASSQNRPDLHFATMIQKARGQKTRTRRALDQATTTQLLGSLEPGMLAGDPATLRDYAIIVVLLETGMRKMSLCSMSLERTSFVPTKQNNYPHTWVRIKGHGADDVSIPLSDTAIAALAPWISWLAKNGKTSGPIFRGLSRQIGSMGPFYKIDPEALYRDYINRILNQRSAGAGIEHIHPHQFRHTFVTWRLEAGLKPHEIAAITAHTLPGLGAMGGYIDMNVVVDKVRNSTPAWLKELVTR